MSFSKSKYFSTSRPQEFFLVSYQKDTPNRSLKAYVRSYSKTIDTLIDPIIERGESYPSEDLLLFPFLFLARQVLELELKRLLFLIRYRYDDQYEITNGHNLQLLFEDLLRSMNKPEIPKDFIKEFKNIRPLISFYTDFDKESQTFRYPHNRNSITHEFNSEQIFIKISVIKDEIKLFLQHTWWIEDQLDELFGNTIA